LSSGVVGNGTEIREKQYSLQAKRQSRAPLHHP